MPPRPRPPAGAAAGSSLLVEAATTTSVDASGIDPSLENAATGVPLESAMSMRTPSAGTLVRRQSITPPGGEYCGAAGSAAPPPPRPHGPPAAPRPDRRTPSDSRPLYRAV